MLNCTHFSCRGFGYFKLSLFILSINTQLCDWLLSVHQHLLVSGFIACYIIRLFTPWFDCLRHGSITYTTVRLRTPWFECLRDDSIVCEMIRLLTTWFDFLRNDSISYNMMRFLTQWFDCLRHESIAINATMIIFLFERLWNTDPCYLQAGQRALHHVYPMHVCLPFLLTKASLLEHRFLFVLLKHERSFSKRVATGAW